MRIIWRKYRLIALLVPCFFLMRLTLFGISEFSLRVLPYFTHYDVQVVLEPGGEPVGWDCLDRVFGYDMNGEKRDNARFNKRRRLSSTDFRVPNIVHFVTFGRNRTFSFVNYLSVLSAYKVQNPDIILFHHDYRPVGKWWEKCIEDVPILQMIRQNRPKDIRGKAIDIVYHASDIARLEILISYGGIYIDFDVILIQPLDELRQYPCTLGKEIPPKFISGIIIAEKGSLFLKVWYETYKHNYVGILWDYNSAYVPYYIYTKHPKLIHVEEWKLTTPDWTQREELLKDNINWRDLYLMHFMLHQEDQYQYSPETIKAHPGVMGSVMRNLYYGNPDKILPDKIGGKIV